MMTISKEYSFFGLFNKTAIAIKAIVIFAFLMGCNQNNHTKSQSAQTDNIPPPSDDLSQGSLTFFNADSQSIISIVIEIADDEYSRAQGLMFRKNLPETQGMLFIFEQERRQHFWMKNTSVSLDMIFLNSRNKIVHIEKYTEPYSKRTYPSVKPAKYVVEVVAGFTDRYDIKAGQQVQWKRID
ncbi:MAG: DUF192 domain-containing protein [Caldithrix sp.]|nr:DUF192 domain-containing protein [Caldithrix sp.]